MPRVTLIDWGADRAATFKCPGCGDTHVIRVSGPKAWGFNGSVERPTFTPSLLVRTGHFVTPGECWCNYDKAHPDDASGFACYRCHSFITDGRIQFLGDCTHALAGQTVDLPEIE